MSMMPENKNCDIKRLRIIYSVKRKNCAKFQMLLLQMTTLKPLLQAESLLGWLGRSNTVMNKYKIR